jgi:type VI secretion system secreted protein Hcp
MAGATAADNFLWFPEPAKGGLLTQTTKAAQPEGETTDDWFKDKKALEISNFSWGVEQAETTGSSSTGSGAGKAKFKEFTVSKGIDLASVPLFNACTAGAHFPHVCIAMRKPGGSNLIYLQYIFTQVFVIGIKWSGGAGEEAPKEDITMKFGAYSMQYIQQKADGTEGGKQEGFWSSTKNKNTGKVEGLSDPPSFMPASQA